VGHAAYRILQESLTNVLRHAGVQARATVCLRYEPGALAIRVTDDGDGPGTAAGDGTVVGTVGGDGTEAGTHPAGHGLTGMAERAAAVGGSFAAAAGPDGGFEVVARLPAASAGQATASGTAPPAADLAR
jgi:signal transduction histidine kinase